MCLGGKCSFVNTGTLSNVCRISSGTGVTKEDVVVEREVVDENCCC